MRFRVKHVFGLRVNELLERAVSAYERWVEFQVGPEKEIIFTSVEYESGQIVKGDIKMAILKEGQSLTLTAKPKSKGASPTKIQPDSAEWTSSDDSIATVTELTDTGTETTAKVVALKAGEALITLKADADLGEGVREVTGVEAVAVIVGDAVGFDLVASAPVDEP